MKRGIHRGLLPLLLLASVALFAQKVTVQHDPAADFSKYKTYAWTGGTPSPNPVWDEVIQATFSYELEEKGLKRAEPKDADLLIAYHAAGQTNLNVAESFQVVYVYPSYGMWYSGGLGGSARYIKKGTLAVHLFDRQKKQVVWSATAKEPVADTPKKKVEQLNKVADKMFAAFPPPPPAKP